MTSNTDKLEWSFGVPNSRCHDEDEIIQEIYNNDVVKVPQDDTNILNGKYVAYMLFKVENLLHSKCSYETDYYYFVLYADDTQFKETKILGTVVAPLFTELYPTMVRVKYWNYGISSCHHDPIGGSIREATNGKVLDANLYDLEQKFFKNRYDIELPSLFTNLSISAGNGLITSIERPLLITSSRLAVQSEPERDNTTYL